MGDKTGIEWTDATWNPLRGCSRISEGCRNCYAETVAHRFSGPGMPYEGLTRIVNGHPAWTGEVRMIPELLDQPLRWKRPRRIFVNSMSDLFHESVPDSFIDRVFAVMWACHFCDGGQSKHVFQILTKRAQRMRDYLKQDRRENWARAAVNIAGKYDPDGLFDDIANSQTPHPRIWLGVSVENQKAADERIPLLLDTPAAVRWISAEPLLSDMRLGSWLQRSHSAAFGDGRVTDRMPFWTRIGSTKIDWVVAGGESGPHARPTHPEWMRSLRDQCKAAGVRFFFKQWGEWHTGYINSSGIPVFRQFTTYQQWINKADTWVRGGICIDSDGRELKNGADMIRADQEKKFPVIIMHKVGKKRAGRLLDGVLHDEYPSNDYKS